MSQSKADDTMFKKVVFWKVLKRSRCALLKELSTGRLGILIAWDVPRSTASKSMRVERGGREFVLQRPRHRSRWATTTTCFYCWRPLGIRHSRQKAEPSLSLPPRRPPRPSYGTKGTTILHTIYILLLALAVGSSSAEFSLFLAPKKHV